MFAFEVIKLHLMDNLVKERSLGNDNPIRCFYLLELIQIYSKLQHKLLMLIYQEKKARQLFLHDILTDFISVPTY